jgi:heme exporter protein A
MFAGIRRHVSASRARGDIAASGTLTASSSSNFNNPSGRPSRDDQFSIFRPSLFAAPGSQPSVAQEPFAPARQENRRMSLQAHQLACTRGDRDLFSDTSFEIQRGDALRVAGANGSGKTSLLRILCGLSCPAHGEVRWNGRNIRSLREEFRSQLIYLGHANGVKDDLLAWENIVVASTLAGRAVTRDAAYDALDQLGLGRIAELPTRLLSQGQRKRVAMARLRLGMAAPLWILDEPFTALDQAAVAELCATLDTHLSGGGMVIYTTHQDIELKARRMLGIDIGGTASC